LPQLKLLAAESWRWLTTAAETRAATGE